MSFVVEAIYVDGTLKPAQPLPLEENERVTITIEARTPSPATPGKLTYGLIGWSGDADVVRRVALEPEFGVQESP